MMDAPRRIGRPLDADSAAARVRQIAILADPLRLRTLSAIATIAESGADAEAIAELIGEDVDQVATSITDLLSADLIATEGSSLHLTAEAWIRFGRLLVATGSTSIPERARPISSGVEALPPVAARIASDLAYRFSSVFSPETVAKYVAESYLLLSERAHITRYLPSLTTRFASDRLSALATANGLVLRGTPEVLFVCVQNAGRSQMAAAILRYLAGGRVHVRTAGSSPASAVHASVVDALDEIGIPLASEFPKPLTDEVVQAADYVVTMGCGDACPIYPGRRYMDWTLADPVGLSMDEVRIIRDDIFARVESLLAGMKLSPEGSNL